MAENLGFTHLDEANKPRMVDVRKKAPSDRSARAEATVAFSPAIFERLSACDWQGKKGPILQAAIIAGTQAVKRTADLIPFCHPLPIRHCAFFHNLQKNRLHLICEVGCTDQTGVEMEALTGASIAALTVYDMCKALGDDIVIEDVRVVSKRGGKRDYTIE